MKMYRGLMAVVIVCMMAFCARADEDMKLAAQGNNAFAFDLFGHLAGGDGNLFYSPYSIESALAMTYAGAKGQTAQEMAQTLRFELQGNKLHAAMGQLHKVLNSEHKDGRERMFELVTANALWGQRGYPFNPAYIELVRSDYGGGLNEVDFLHATEQARQTINGWVEKQTNDKIKDLIGAGDLSPDARLVLTNAIYFKSGWAEEFSPQLTEKQPFTSSGGKTVQAQMMHQQERFNYGETDDAQVVELPYRGYDLSMVVILPKKADGIAELAKGMDSGKFGQMVGQLRSRKVMLGLPKFKMSQRVELAKTLSEMGMGLAFDPMKADFGGICSQERLCISKVIHQAFVDVNEEGTEAAAATAVVVRVAGAVIQEQPVTFQADHPFIFVIRHRESGAILFVGRVMDPTAE